MRNPRAEAFERLGGRYAGLLEAEDQRAAALDFFRARLRALTR